MRCAAPERVRGVPKVPQHTASRGDGARTHALLHVIEMCCLNETMTGVFLTEMLDRATHATARAAIESLLEDEIDHGRVGWAYLASVCREKWGATIAREALPALLRRTVAPVLEGARAKGERDDRRAEAHGYLLSLERGRGVQGHIARRDPAGVPAWSRGGYQCRTG